MKIEVKNDLSFEEAKQLWFSKKEIFPNDYVAFYIESPKEEDEDEEVDGLITPLSELEVVEKEKDKFTDCHILIDAGDKCLYAKSGDTVIFDSSMMMQPRLVMLDEQVFALLPERSIALFLKS